jgi:hypothetical protein
MFDFDELLRNGTIEKWDPYKPVDSEELKEKTHKKKIKEATSKLESELDSGESPERLSARDMITHFAQNGKWTTEIVSSIRSRCNSYFYPRSYWSAKNDTLKGVTYPEPQTFVSYICCF